MAMVGLTTDIPSADLILRLFKKLKEVDDEFAISDAIELRTKVTEEYAVIKEKFEKLNKKNK